MATYLYYQECETSDGLTEQIVNSLQFHNEIAYRYYLDACNHANVDAKTLWTNYDAPLIMKATEDFYLPGSGCGYDDDVVVSVKEGEIIFFFTIEDVDKLNEIYKDIHGVTFIDHHTIWEYTDELAEEVEEHIEYLELN